MELLTQYVESGSEDAFRQLVNNYIDLVYSTALRLLGGDRHLAEDVTQTVFVHLCRNAGRLPRENTIVIREKDAWQTLDGGWARTYGFADGHTEIHKAPPDGNFQPWEAQRLVTAAAGSGP